MVILLTPVELSANDATAAESRRIALGLTQRDLADAAGVSLATWKKFARTGQGSLRLVAAAASALHCAQGIAALFPAPEVRTLDDILGPPKRKRARHRRSP